MARMIWDEVGKRRFESGIDRGVLFVSDGTGVPWNGLTSVSEDNPGVEVKPYYLDGIKYLETMSRGDFAGSIEAFTYPDEFGVYDGTITLATGLIAMQQRRKQFALSYRTRVGNDVEGQEAGYKLHLVYNVFAQPSSKSYSTRGDTTEPSKFTWAFSTTPKRPKAQGNFAPLAHVIIDSTKTNPNTLAYIEERLYGSARYTSKLISLDEIFQLFEVAQFSLSIFKNTATGLNQLIVETTKLGDLFGERDLGYYDITGASRLKPTAKPGLNRMES